MKRYIAAIAVWAAAAALFAAINVQAKPGDVVAPDVVGMTVAAAHQAWIDAGFTRTPNVNPGNLDPATVPDAIVVGQTPKAGTVQSANYRGAFFIGDAQPTPTPTPTESPTPTPSPSSTPSADEGALPMGEVEGAVETRTGGGAGGTAGETGSLSFTL